jgi:hypothetical protein
MLTHNYTYPTLLLGMISMHGDEIKDIVADTELDIIHLCLCLLYSGVVMEGQTSRR